MSDDRMAQNAGKTFADTPGVAGKEGGKTAGAPESKMAASEPTDEEAAIMKQKAIAAAQAKGSDA